jgi:hypothetical protein
MKRPCSHSISYTWDTFLQTAALSFIETKQSLAQMRIFLNELFPLFPLNAALGRALVLQQVMPLQESVAGGIEVFAAGAVVSRWRGPLWPARATGLSEVAAKIVTARPRNFDFIFMVSVVLQMMVGGEFFRAPPSSRTPASGQTLLFFDLEVMPRSQGDRI